MNCPVKDACTKNNRGRLIERTEHAPYIEQNQSNIDANPKLYKKRQAIVEHPDITAISFTGGTMTGKKIASTAAPMFKKLSLELGGKNPNIIFADCDFEQAMATSIQSSFSNQGEICL